MNEKNKSRLLLGGFIAFFVIIMLVMFQQFSPYLTEQITTEKLLYLNTINPKITFETENDQSEIMVDRLKESVSVLVVSADSNTTDLQFLFSILSEIHTSLKRKQTGKILSLLIGDRTELLDRQLNQLREFWEINSAVWTLGSISDDEKNHLFIKNENKILENQLYLVDKQGNIRASFSLKENQLVAKVITDISMLLREDKK